MNKSQIYGKLLLANSHAKEMGMDTVDAVYPEEFTEAELEELKDFCNAKFKEIESVFIAILHTDRLVVTMDYCSVTFLKK